MDMVEAAKAMSVQLGTYRLNRVNDARHITPVFLDAISTSVLVTTTICNRNSSLNFSVLLNPTPPRVKRYSPSL